MKKKITVAGATGNLGERIVRELVLRGAEVRALVRSDSNAETINRLTAFGASVIKISTWNLAELTAACAGSSCVVSALAGLRDVVIDAQKVLLAAAVAAGVPRFIPSDYSLDFLKFKNGENRNLDLRREFHTYLDQATISATSIFNGAFAELLTGEMPFVLYKQKRVLYWGNADRRWEFTTMDNTAQYTANAALDDTAPRYLRIAGDQISPRMMQTVITGITGEKFRLFRAGGKGLLGMLIKVARTVSPGKQELYPAWQGMQYMHNMIDDRSVMTELDNNRYRDVQWTTAKELLATFEQTRQKSGN